MSGRRGRSWLVLGVGIVLAGALASAVVASRIDDGSDVVAAIDEAPLTRVADIESADGAAELGVYAQVTETGHRSAERERTVRDSQLRRRTWHPGREKRDDLRPRRRGRRECECRHE